MYRLLLCRKTVTAAEAEDTAALTDADILNFALNLEYLEAEYYLRATTGKGLSASETTGTGKHGKVTGGAMVPFKTTSIKAYAEEIAGNEKAHVGFLRAALGKSAIAEPTINLSTSWNISPRRPGLETASILSPTRRTF